MVESAQSYISVLLCPFPLSSSPRPSAIASLYGGIRCKTCGRRIRDQSDMGSHLDWHSKMNKRAALLAKSIAAAASAADAAGDANAVNRAAVRSQNYYWEESEWIEADDVIFGVQTRAGAAKGAKPGATATAAAPQAEDEMEGASELLRKRAPQHVVADDNQKKCPVRRRRALAHAHATTSITEAYMHRQEQSNLNITTTMTHIGHDDVCVSRFSLLVLFVPCLRCAATRSSRSGATTRRAGSTATVCASRTSS